MQLTSTSLHTFPPNSPATYLWNSCFSLFLNTIFKTLFILACLYIFNGLFVHCDFLHSSFRLTFFSHWSTTQYSSFRENLWIINFLSFLLFYLLELHLGDRLWPSTLLIHFSAVKKLLWSSSLKYFLAITVFHFSSSSWF